MRVLYIPGFTQKVVSLSQLLSDKLMVSMNNRDGKPTVTVSNNRGRKELARFECDETGTEMYFLHSRPESPNTAPWLHSVIRSKEATQEAHKRPVRHRPQLVSHPTILQSKPPNVPQPLPWQRATTQYHTPMKKQPTAKERANQPKISLSRAHELYGHSSEQPLRKTLQRAGIATEGQYPNCTACMRAKAKAKGVPKSTTTVAQKPGERLFVDLSGPYKKSLIGSNYWLLVVDDHTRKSWSFFMKKKSDIANKITPLLEQLRGSIKYMRCDNAGENVSHLAAVCRKFGIQMEYTAPYTPQTNGVVERMFVTIRDRAVAMMIGAQLTDQAQGRLWAEAVNTATRLTNITISSKAALSPDEQWYKKPPNLHGHLVEWGRVGHVTIRQR